MRSLPSDESSRFCAAAQQPWSCRFRRSTEPAEQEPGKTTRLGRMAYDRPMVDQELPLKLESLGAHGVEQPPAIEKPAGIFGLIAVSIGALQHDKIVGFLDNGLTRDHEPLIGRAAQLAQ